MKKGTLYLLLIVGIIASSFKLFESKTTPNEVTMQRLLTKVKTLKAFKS